MSPMVQVDFKKLIMIPNNFFRAVAEFFSEVLFSPYKVLGSLDNWWLSNAFNFTLFTLTSILFIYWILQLQKFKRAKTE